MANSTKMLQAIIDGQKGIKEELLDKVGKVDKKIDEVKAEVVKNGKRIDKLGLELAELSDDAPTIEEFDNLEKRVGKVEKQIASV